MRCIETAELGDHLAERGEFRRVRVHPGCVGQSAGHADRALIQTLCEQFLHVPDLGGRGRALVGAHREQPQRALWHQVGGIGCDALIEPVEILGDAAPGEVQIAWVAVPTSDLSADDVKRGIVDRRVGDSVLADHLGGHTLADLREVAGIGEQAQV